MVLGTVIGCTALGRVHTVDEKWTAVALLNVIVIFIAFCFLFRRNSKLKLHVPFSFGQTYKSKRYFGEHNHRQNVFVLFVGVMGI